MKRIFAWILLVIMLVGTLAGCGCQKRQNVDPTATTAPVAGDTNIQDVIEYLKAIYKDDGAETYVDFERFGIVRIAGVPYEVVWTVDVSEDLVKVVVNDDGTVTIDVNEKCEKETPYVLTATVTGEDGSTASHSWNYILPEAVDMVAIVKAAYALANGQSMDYEVTLTGEITMINTPYSEEYKNITVTIVVEGAEDMPIECYRLKGDGADELQIGDTITVTGTLKNYNGTIEFDAGCILESVVPGERVKAPDDPKQIVDEAYALGANQSLKYEATLTGKITQIKDAYSEQYKNITVVMVVAGRENKPITCYRMKGAGADDLDVGDTITVRGYITNYVGSAGYSTIEFTAGCQLISYENTGKEFIMPGTAAGIVNLAYSLKEGESLPEKATLTGVVTTVDTAYSSQYKNVTVTMVIGDMYDKPITCYRMKGSGADVIDEGYTITVTGILKNYKGKIEFDTGCSLDKYTAPPKPEGPTVSYEGTVVDAPVADKPYKLGLVQGNISGEPTLYFSGNVANTYYLSTSKDGAKAVDVVLKAAKGGYHLAFTTPSGATKYINMLQVTTDKLHTNLAISDKAETVYTYDTALKTLTVKMPDGKTYYIGTYSEYTTLSASDVEKINGSFPVHFMELKVVSGPASMEEGVKQLKTDYPNGYKDDYTLPTSVQVRDDVFAITWKVVTEDAKAVAIKGGKLVFERQVDEVPYKLIATLTKGNEKIDVEWEYSVPRKPAAIEVVTSPEIGKAYRLALTQENLGGSVLFLNGERDGNYFATSDKSYEGVEVFAEKAGNGIRIYFMDEGVKTYVDMYEYQTDKIGVAFNTTLTETSAIYKIDTEKKALIATFDLAGTAESRYLGTYNTFNTMSSGKIFDGEIDGFPAMFVIVNEETPVTLNAAAQELVNALPDSGSKTPSSFEVPTTVTLNKTTFQVTWSITPASNAAKVTTAGNACNVELTKGFEDVAYTLKATIKDPANQTKEVTWSYTVPAKGVSTIAQALAGAENDFFEVKGVVTLLDGQNIYIQDATGGICLRFAEAPTDITLGDTVIGGGSKAVYRGLTQLANATYVKSSGMSLSAKTTTIGAMTAADVGTYVKLTGLTVTKIDDNNGTYSSPNVDLKDAEGNTIQLYKAVVGKTGGVWDIKVGDVLDINAAVSTYYENLQLRNTSASEITVVNSGSTEPSETTTETTTEATTETTEPQPTISTIAQALAGADGAEFTVKGVVTLVDGKNIYIQDATGGIDLYFGAAPTDVNLGDTLIGTGARATFRGLPELTNATYEKSSGVTLSAKTTTIGALTTADICTYVKITGLTVTTVTDGTNYPDITVQDAAGNSIKLYKAVVGKTGDEWNVKVGDVLDVTAAVGVYNTTLQLRNTSATEITVVSSGSTEPSETTTETTTEATTETTEPQPTISTIAQALAGADGAEFTVKGVVTLVDGKNIYIQDATGGIDLYFSTAPTDINLGDTLIGTGSRATFRGLPELTNATYEKSSGLSLTTKTTTIGALTTADICTYVKITGLTVTTVTDGTNYPDITVQDAAGNSIKLYKAVVGKTGDEWNVKVGDVLDVTAAVGVYNTTLQLRNTSATEITVVSSADPEPGETTTEATTETTQPAGTAAYTLIDRVADLTAGTYKMGAYLTTANNKTDLSANPYHLWIGTATSGNNGDLNTESYGFANGALTATGDGAAVEIELVAVAGKENTYNIKIGDNYLYTKACDKRKLAVGATMTGTAKGEWVASDFKDGGIILTCNYDANFVTMGTASADSKFIRAYKDTEGAVNSGIKYGLVFFAENTN